MLNPFRPFVSIGAPIGTIVGAVFVGLAFLVVPVGHARAQTSLEGRNPVGQMNAVLYNAVPAGADISVQPMDNSDTNMVLAKAFEKALTQEGYHVTDNAHLVFSFETRNVVGAWSDAGRRSILDLEAHGGKMGGEDASAKLNLYNTNRGGLFNKGKGGTDIVTQGHLRLDATIDDETAHKRLWQGWAESEQGRYQDQEVLSAMVPVVAAAVGKTVRSKPFKMP